MRRDASDRYAGSISTPRKRRPARVAATPVVPDPAKGSRTRSPGEEAAATTRSSSASGFWVGWRPWTFSRGPGVGSDQTTCSSPGAGASQISQRSRICLPPFAAFIAW